jgi:hypothetical protein
MDQVSSIDAPAPSFQDQPVRSSWQHTIRISSRVVNVDPSPHSKRLGTAADAVVPAPVEEVASNPAAPY